MCVDCCNWAPGAAMAWPRPRQGLWQYADLRKVITTDEEVCVDLNRHDRCVVVQRRGVNPRLCMSKPT
jgi:hypothetical protein